MITAILILWMLSGIVSWVSVAFTEEVEFYLSDWFALLALCMISGPIIAIMKARKR